MQALNNWGLVLQDLAALRPRSERGIFLRRSLGKFRQAIHMWPEFDRACYNLGEYLAVVELAGVSAAYPWKAASCGLTPPCSQRYSSG